MTIGFFLDKHHINYISHLAFLSSQVAKYENIKIYTFDRLSTLSSYQLCDVNIFLMRYCFINISSIEKKYKDNIYVIKNNRYNSIAIIPKTKLRKYPKNKTITELIAAVALRKDAKVLDTGCYLKNIDHINCKLDKADFICFNDLYESHMQDMVDCLYPDKEIYYDNKIYTVNRLTDIFDHNNTHACKLKNKLHIVWNREKNKWTKLHKGAK